MSSACCGQYRGGNPIRRNKMKRTKNVLSGLLAAALTITMIPSAYAAQVYCPACNQPDCTASIIKEANCHEEGVEEYYCHNPNCPEFQRSQLRKLDRDPENHDAIYSDNGDGTHSGACSYHSSPVTVQRQRHNFSNGLCTMCRAVDYSEVKISLPENPVVYAAVDDDGASLSLSDVSMSIGTADITNDYDLTYNWYYEGKLISSEKTYTLPTSITSKEGAYKYVCFVMAVPKNSLTTQPISASCTVTVRVQDLITAYAAVGRSDKNFYLGDKDSQSSQTVEEQIYEAVYSRTEYKPDYVIFGTASSSKTGSLKVNAAERYYFDPSNRQSGLKDVAFSPSGDASGTYTINFNAYDTKGKEYPGVLTITVGQSAGDMDVFYTASRDAALKLKAESFDEFWMDAFPRGLFTWVRFTQLPSSAEGSLYVDYVSATNPGTRLRSSDTLYIEPGRSQIGIDDVTFLAGAKQSGYVIIPFEAFGENNYGRQTYLEGNMYILVSNGTVADINCRVTAGGTYALNEADFLSVYQAATNSRGSAFSIQLTSVPESGSLYVNYTSSGRGTKLTASNISGRPFYYSAARGDLIKDITYVPGTSLTDTVSYLAYDAQGKLLYSGNVRFTVGELTVSYNATSVGVNFKASDFEKLLGATGKLSTVSFTPPAAAYGTLYYGRSNTSVGTAITSDSVWYSVSTTNTGVNALSMNNVTFVPKAGYSGPVSIPFSAYDEGNSKVSGTVRITVTAPPPTKPDTNPGTTNPDNGSKPNYTVSFADVPNTTGNAWYYTAVMDLAQAGVIGGRSDGKFYPNDAVTYGEALKMIMLAAGYTEQAPTGNHWASGYMSRAVTDKLLPKSVDPDRKISRYTITEIAAKALKLPANAVQTSPFDDMAANLESAPYVVALYQAGIVNGTTENGKVNFKGTYAIRRCEMSVIIWRINNYNRTGNANG